MEERRGIGSGGEIGSLRDETGAIEGHAPTTAAAVDHGQARPGRQKIRGAAHRGPGHAIAGFLRQITAVGEGIEGHRGVDAQPRDAYFDNGADNRAAEQEGLLPSETEMSLAVMTGGPSTGNTEMGPTAAPILGMVGPGD